MINLSLKFISGKKEVPISIEKNKTIRDLHYLVSLKEKVPEDHFYLTGSRNGTQQEHMCDWNKKPLNQTLEEFGLKEGSVIYFRLDLGGPPHPKKVTYKANISQENITTSVVTSLTPIFNVNFDRDFSFVVNKKRPQGSGKFANGWRERTKDPVDYTFTQQPVHDWIVLLKLSPEFATIPTISDMITHINAVRYNYAGINKTYYGGQDDSWQRYTKDLPIKISTTYNQEIVTITALETLEPNTRYAVVFLNSPQGMYEDYLLPFVTASPTQAPPNSATTTAVKTTVSQLNVSDKVICSGWVSKESGWLKAWRERYCVVRADSITFATNIDTMPHDHIDLNVLLLNWEFEPKQNIMTITTSNGIWRLKVNSNRSATLNAYFLSKLRATDIASIVDATKIVVPTKVVSKPTTIVVPPPQTVNELKKPPTEINSKPSVDKVANSTAATTQSKIAAIERPGTIVNNADNKNSEQHATTTSKKPIAIEQQDSKVFQQDQVKNLNVVAPAEKILKIDVNSAAGNSTITEIAVPHPIAPPQVISSQLLAMLSASQTQLQLLSQTAPQSIAHLTKLGNSGAVTERQHAFIASHPHLQEYYIAFTQAITSAVLAAHTISSGMVKDTRKSIDEKCSEFIDFDKTADWLHIAGSASGIPFASIATGVCKYLIQMPHDIQRKQAINRIVNAFPNINSHKHIETMSREMTILMQIEIQEVSLSKCKQKSLWERAKQTVEWLQTYHNKTPIQSYATTHASMLIQKIIINDKSPLLLAVQHKDIVKLIEWSIDSAYIGEYTVASLLHSIRSGVLQPGHSISNNGGNIKQPPLAVPSVPLQVVDLPTVISPHVVEKSENNTKIQPAIDNFPPLFSPLTVTVTATLPPAETKNQESSVAELLAKIAAMELREKEREIEQSIQKSESEKNRKKLAEMERKMKKLDVIHDIFGGADSDQVKVQQTKSVHEKLDDHLKKSSVASAAQDQIIADLQLLKAHTGFQDYQFVSETDSVKVKQDKLDLFK